MSEGVPRRIQYGGSRHRRAVCCLFCRAEFSITEHREHLPICPSRPVEDHLRGYRKGTKFTEDHRRKIGEALKGKKHRPWTEEERRRAGERLKGNTRGCGYRWTEEQRAKIKGRPSWCKGLKMSEDFCRKISEAKRGKPRKLRAPKPESDHYTSPINVVHEPPIRINPVLVIHAAATQPNPVVKSKIGHKHTKEWKRAMSERMKGNNFNLGRKASPETCRKISESNRGKVAWHAGGTLSEDHKRKIGLAHTGKKRAEFSEEWKRNIGKAHIGLTRGEKSGAWKGGVTSLRKQIRDSYKYRGWRTSVFQRDDFTCQHCQQRGGKLQVDHYPKTFERLIRENQIKTLDDALNCAKLWDADNGRTLCRACHRKTETWGTRGREKAA